MAVVKSLCVFFFLFAVVTAQINLNTTIFFDGGLPFCSICGLNGQYACSPGSGQSFENWNNGYKNFTLPIPTGLVVTSFTATVFGDFGCGSTGATAIFGLTLNGAFIGAQQGSSSPAPCECGTCSGGITFQSLSTNYTIENQIYTEPLPYYNTTVPNILQLVVFRDSICVNRIAIKVTANKATPNVLKISQVVASSPTFGRQTCGNQGSACVSTSTNITLNFYNQLPPGAILLTVSGALYGGYNPSSNNVNDPFMVNVALANAPIGGSVSNPNLYKKICGGATFFSTKSYFPNGWPGYQYGSGYNRLTVSNPSNYPGGCYSTALLQLFYYVPTINTEQKPINIVSN